MSIDSNFQLLVQSIADINSAATWYETRLAGSDLIRNILLFCLAVELVLSMFTLMMDSGHEALRRTMPTLMFFFVGMTLTSSSTTWQSYIINPLDYLENQIIQTLMQQSADQAMDATMQKFADVLNVQTSMIHMPSKMTNNPTPSGPPIIQFDPSNVQNVTQGGSAQVGQSCAGYSMGYQFNVRDSNGQKVGLITCGSNGVWQ